MPTGESSGSRRYVAAPVPWAVEELRVLNDGDAAIPSLGSLSIDTLLQRYESDERIPTSPPGNIPTGSRLVTVPIEQDPTIVHFNFRPMEQTEMVGCVIPIGPDSTFWEYREQLERRPFYIKAIRDNRIRCRCPGVREELGFGDAELCRQREFVASGMEVLGFTSEALPGLYELYRQRQGGEYKEPVTGFVWETVPDEEDKIVSEKKKKRILFRGVFDPGYDLSTRNDFVYLSWSGRNVLDRTVIDFFLVDCHGNKLPQGRLFSLLGNGRGGEGCLELTTGINSNLGFEVDSRGQIKLV